MLRFQDKTGTDPKWPTQFYRVHVCHSFLPEHTSEQATVLQCQPRCSENVSSSRQAVFRIRHTMGTRATRVYVTSCLHHLWRVFYSLFKQPSASLWNPGEFKCQQVLITLPRCPRGQACNCWLYSDTDLSTQCLSNASLETLRHVLHFKNHCIPKHWSMLSTAPLNCSERLVTPVKRTGNRHKNGFWEKNLILQGKQEPGPILAIVAKHSGILRRQLGHCCAKRTQLHTGWS